MIFAQAGAGEIWSGSPAGLCPNLTDGLRRRRGLFEAILSDLLGAQTALRRGLLPQELLPPLALLQGTGQTSPYLRSYTADLVCCPDGAWRVAADHTAAPQNHHAAALFEAPAMAAFLPALGRLLATAAPFLPSIPTIWLADPQARRLAMQHPHRWAIRDAIDPATLPIPVSQASLDLRQSLQHRLHTQPWRLAATLVCSTEAEAERHTITLELITK